MSAEAPAVRRWREVSARVGRNDLPGLLFTHLDVLAPADLPEAVTRAWAAAEWPEQCVPAVAWLRAFDLAAEVRDLGTADLPETVTLYRGAIPERRAGLSWTGDRATADWFAHRFDGMGGGTRGRVWRITIPAGFVVAHLTARGEDEYVVDTTAFDDEEYEEVVS